MHLFLTQLKSTFWMLCLLGLSLTACAQVPPKDRPNTNEGFTNVYNLYGSIFDWVEKGYPLENAEGNSTLQVHTYNQRWGKLLTRPDVDKIW